MSIDLSRRINRIKASATMAVTALAAQLRAEGKDVIGLGAGEPDFDTPSHIKEAAMQAIRDGHTKYTEVGGTAELKQAVIDKYARDNDLQYVPDQIIVSAGAKQCIFNLCQILLDDGDEVIVPAPYWVSYHDIPRLCGARVTEMFAGPGQHFRITPDQLAASISDRTRLVLLNSPCNPTGAVYTRDELAALGEVLLEHEQVVVATDDIYEHICWADEPFCSFATANPALRDRTVVINGVSKAYAMTGWRIGYAAGPVELVAAMKKVQGQSTTNAASVSQAAAVAALQGEQQCVAAMTAEFRERHDYVLQQLESIPDVHCEPAGGTFYLFPDMRRLIRRLEMEDDLELTRHLLDEAGVALVGGSAFGAPGFVRISYATALTKLETAMDRLKVALG
ncbi:MAG: pyridoxal phosphate-dependent aminotransferase [Gammaproteobacteria bacterium]|nr:pyridoxal phosphate-dependent aminotransferase [Gammaproteobacteria bacterium]NNF61902.1 pyridoxal phosphate-dependent aminotransferase [Gammaproteobacteria bacterium]NNM19794.1 pyridoxal phosphate-dependent aminotransferase [Gammaproteobacteria bacterium]